MPGEVIKISGLEEVRKRLRDMPRRIVLSAFLEALKAGAGVIEGEVAARTPVSDKDDEHLIESLTHDIELDPNGKGGRARVGFGKQGQKAMWVEYGHRMVGHAPGKKQLGTVPPHPFMRPAAEASAEAAIEAFRNALDSKLKAP